MKACRSVLFLFVTCCQLMLAQGPFEKTYSTTRDRAMRDVLRIPNGDYLLCGWTNVVDASECDAIVLRTDINGNVLPGWPKTFGKNGPAKVDFAYSMVEASDGTYLIVGYSSSYGGGDLDAYLIKMGADGTEIAVKTYGGFGWDEAREIIKCADGNYAIVGSTTVGSDQQAFIMKIDKDGNPLWSPAMKLFGSGNKEFGNCIAEHSDGSFYVGGQSMGSDSRGDSYLIKTNGNGTSSWEKIYGEALADEVADLVVNADGSVVVVIRDSTANKDIDVRIRKFDSAGDPVAGYNKQIGGNLKDTPKTITQSKDGNYYVGVTSRSWNWRGNSYPDTPDMWLLKVNASSGDTIWSRNFGGPDHDHCERVKVDPVQDAILLCGHQVTGVNRVKFPYFLKINNDGLLAELGLGVLTLEDGTLVYPNPANSRLNLELSNLIGPVHVRLLNRCGQVVMEEKNSDPGQSETIGLDLQAQAPGMYLLQIDNNNQSLVKKIIVYH